MLTLKQFIDLPDNEIFAKGIVQNNPEGVHLTNNRLNNDLMWVAKKGSANDWAVYIAWAEKGEEYTENHGDKILIKDHILRLVPCEEVVLHLYRK